MVDQSSESSAPPLVLYDGDCGFCHRSVRFALRHERGGRLRFAALNSPTGRAALAAHGLPADFGKSVVLIEHGRAFTFSSATVRLARHLNYPWKLLAIGWSSPSRCATGRIGSWRVIAEGCPHPSTRANCRNPNGLHGLSIRDVRRTGRLNERTLRSRQPLWGRVLPTLDPTPQGSAWERMTGFGASDLNQREKDRLPDPVVR